MTPERDDHRFFGLSQHSGSRFRRPGLQVLDRRPFPPLRYGLGVDAELPAQLRERSLRSLYCCSDGVRGRGAPVTNLSHSASFHPCERIAPSNHGIKQADGPDRKWGADISYIWTADGWLYFAVVLDLFCRRVVGWATSDRLKRDLAVEALRRALVARNPTPGLIHHSDRGSQYCSVDYQALLRKRGILISMSGRGNCYDNSMVETFFKTIKSELIWPVAWQSRQQAENAVARYIDGFYNPVRRHSSPGFQSPIAFERKVREVS